MIDYVRQALVLHLCCWTAAPGQVFPPFLGAGLLQLLVLFLIPPPHVLVHLMKAPQLLHLPFSIVFVNSLSKWVITCQTVIKNCLVSIYHIINLPSHHWEPLWKALLHFSYGSPLHLPSLPKHPTHGMPDLSWHLRSFDRKESIIMTLQ